MDESSRCLLMDSVRPHPRLRDSLRIIRVSQVNPTSGGSNASWICGKQGWVCTTALRR